MSEENKSNSLLTPYKLKYPFEWSGKDGKEMIEVVTFYRPKGKHIKNFNRNVGMKDLLKLASQVNTEGFTPAFFDEMDAGDCMEVTEVMGNFLDNGQETGEIN